MENGAMRNFECIRLAEKQAEIEAKQAKDEEVNNPMKVSLILIISYLTININRMIIINRF